MITEMKKIFTEQANYIPNWKKLSKTELCNLYIQNEDNSFLKDCYFSAIILNYWNKIYKLQENTYLTASLEDAYQWVVDSILYALKHRKWTDPKNKLYTDPDAPDKVINRRIKCLRINHLVSVNRDKRKVQVNMLSLDQFDDADNFIGGEEKEYDIVSDIVRKLCNDNHIVQAIILDHIANYNCFDKTDGSTEFDVDKLIQMMCEIDDSFVEDFSFKYDLTKSVVSDTVHKELYEYSFIDLWGYGNNQVQKSPEQIKKIVEKELNQLKTNSWLRNLLC